MVDWLKLSGAQEPIRNPVTAGLSSGVDDLQGIGYSALGAVADTFGADKVRDWANVQAATNQYESQINGRPDLDKIEDVAGSPSKWLPYLGYQIAKQTPNIVGAVASGVLVPEAAVPAALTRLAAYGPRMLGMGGLESRVAASTAEALANGGSIDLAAFGAKKAALEAGRTFTKQVVGGGAFNYGQGVGSLYQESVDGGDPSSGGKALLGGVPYSLTETLPQAMLVGRIGHGSGFAGRLAARMGKSAGVQSASGATSEYLQNEMEMGYNGSVTPEQAFSRRLNSVTTGGLVEGVLGSFGGVRGNRSKAPQIEGGQTADMLQHVQLDGGLDSYAPSDGPQYGVNPPTSGQQGAPLDPNQFDMFNPNGTPTYHANPDGPMVTVADTQAALDAPGAPTADVINQAVGVGAPRYAGKNYPSQFAAAANEPTGQHVPDSENGQIEHAETAIEALQRPLNAPQPLHPAVQEAAQQQQANNAQADRAQAMEAQKQEAIQHTTALYGAPEERVEGTTAVHKWLGGGAAVNGVGNYYTKTHADSAVLKQAEADAKRVDETDAPPDVVRAAEAAYAESWREAERAKEKNAGDPSDTKMVAKPVVPGLFKSKQFTQFVEGTNSTQEVADRVKHAMEAEEARGDKADYVLVHRLKAFHEKLTGTVAPKQQPAPVAQAPVATPKASTAVAPVQHEVAATENASPGGEVAVVTPEALAERVTRMATELVAKLGLDPNKTVMLGRKGREKPFNAVQFASKLLTNPEDQPTERARRSAKIDQITVLAATGRDADGDMVSNPLTLDQVALLRSRLEGGSPVSRVAVSNTLAKYGIDEDMASMMVGGDIGPTINASELLGAVEDGDAAGYRIGRSLTDVTSNALLSNSDTEAQKALSDEAGRLSKEDKLALDNAAVDEFLAPPKQEAIEVESNRRLTAERTKAAPAPRLSMVEGEMNASEADEVNERARNEERYARSVMLEWNSNLDDGDIAFEELLEKDQRDVVSLQKLVDDGVVTKREQREIHYAIHDKHHERQNRISAGVQRPNKQITGNGPAGVRTSSGSTESDIPNGRASDNGGGLGQVLSAGAGKQSSPNGEVQTPTTQGPDVQGSQATVTPDDTANQGPVVRRVRRVGVAPSDDSGPARVGAGASQAGTGATSKGAATAEDAGGRLLRGQPGIAGSAAKTSGTDEGAVREPVDGPGVAAGGVVQDAGQALWEKLRATMPDMTHYDDLTENEKGALTDWADSNPGDHSVKKVISGPIGQVVEDHSPGGALHIPAYSKVTSNGQTPFPESTVTHAVYHGTRSNFDSGAMEAGDIGIHFGTPAQASDRAGLTDEEKIYRKGVNTHPEDVQFHAGQAINDARRPGYSGQMGKRRMLKIYIDLRNPLRTKDASGWDRLADMVRTVQDAGIELSSQTLDLIKQAKARGQSVISLQTPKDSSIARAYESVRSDIKAAGYDGIVYNNTSEGPRYQALFGGSESNRDSYIVFDKSQISSPDYDLNYSKAAKTQGSKAADILADIKKLMRLDGLSSKVVVVQSVADLPQGVQKSVSVDADTQGFVVNGKAYLVADNIAPGKARSVFLHEVGAHLGLENLLGKAQFAALVGKIKQWAAKADGSQESKLAQAAQQRVTDAGTSAAQSDTELLAYFIEEAVDAGVDPTAVSYKTDLGRWVQQVWAAFKQALARMGVKPESLTARDVVDMAYGAARIEASSGAASKVGEVLGRGASFSKAKPVTTQSVVRDVPTAVTDLTDYLKMGRDAVAIRGMFTEDLVNLAAKVIPAAKGYLSAMKTIQAKRGAAERAVESVLNQFRTLSNAEQGTGPTSVNAFLKESTFSGKWAFMPDWLPKGSVEVDKDLAQQFSDMLPNKAAQDVVKAVFKHGYTSLQEMKNAALAMHASEYDVMIADARKSGDATEVAKLNRLKAKSMKDFQSLFAIHEFKPYAPLKRFGNYVVLATSARYKAAHEAGDTKTMQELQSDGAHYHVEFAETPWAARKLVATLTPKFPDGFVGKMEKSDDSMMMGGRDTLAAFGRLRKSIKENTDDELMGIDRKTAARMDDMMRQMYLTLLSEASARKSEIHRKNVAGADGDMMRAFATQGRATAHFIAGLQTSGQVDDHIASMREQTRRLDSGPQREERQKYLNEIMRRHSMGLEYHPSPIIDKLMSSSSVMMLLTNPAYHVLNALQPGLMTQPLLAARHGYSKSWGELRRAYTDLGPILRSLKFDETSYAKLPKDVRQAISDLADKGVIDIMMDADLGRFESEPDSALRGVSTVTEKLRHIAQNVEAMNRLSSAIAAYRLEKTKDNATHQSAVDYAAKVIYESHGDYSGFNAPRFMHNDIGRVLTQFRKFQLIQLSLVTREFHRAFFGESAEVKTAGRYALSYTLGHLLATAGVMGLPGATAIGWALGKMTPDDEPDDPEATLRRLIGNKQAADLLIKGAPKALGMDLSRTGAGNMLSLFPYADIDISRDGYPKLLMAATGPFFGGLLPRMAEGLTQVSRGNVVKGVEGFMPNGVSNVLRSARFASDGITKTNGDVTLSADELGALDVLAQAFGLPTNKVTDKNFLSNSQYNAEQFYKDKSSELKQRYTKAAKTNDADTMRSLREEWTRVQTTSKEVGITPQPLQNLLKAPGEQRKREQGTQYGVAYTKSTAGYSPALME